MGRTKTALSRRDIPWSGVVIFATVGTHEDPFNRLVAELDRLAGAGTLSGKVHIQRGYSTVEPKHCTHERMMDFNDVQAAMGAARIVITHGGPASIMQALALGKVPIVVPRQHQHGEHVDDHQCRFAAKIADRVVVVLDIATLESAIHHYDETVARFRGLTGGPERARAFGQKLDALCRSLLPSRVMVPSR